MPLMHWKEGNRRNENKERGGRGWGPLCGKGVEKKWKEGEGGEGRDRNKGRRGRGWEGHFVAKVRRNGEGGKGRGGTVRGSAITGINPYC